MCVPTCPPNAMASAEELTLAFQNNVAMFARQAEQIRRMGREMRHTGEVGLRQIVNCVPPY